MVEGLEEWSMFLDRSMKESDLEEGISSGVPLVRLLLAKTNHMNCHGNKICSEFEYQQQTHW